MKIYWCIIWTFFWLGNSLVFSQNEAVINAELNDLTKTIKVNHQFTYHNTTKDTLANIQFMDWANAFSAKDTPLAMRFNEDFRRAFHFSNTNDRGFTEIESITNQQEKLNWQRPKGMPDVVEVTLKNAVLPNEKITLSLIYEVKIPNDRFTKFGYDKKGYQIKFWHLSPAIYKNGWQVYSHKNLNDFASQLSNYQVQLTIPNTLRVESNLEAINITQNATAETVTLKGEYVPNVKLFLAEQNSFFSTNTDATIVTSDIPTEGIEASKIQDITKKVTNYVEQYFGKLPQKKILLSYKDYLKQPVYGFNQLPKFLRPFKKEFQYEIITLKQLLSEVKRTYFVSNLRAEQWISDGLQIYLLIKYIEKYYPEEKFAGRISKIFGVRWFQAAKLSFNDQYYLGYQNMASRFLDQPLGMAKDSLIKFNYNIANPYRAGMGLHYLESYLGDATLDSIIVDFNKTQQLQTVDASDFIQKLEKSSTKDLSWFTHNFIYQDLKTDVKIKGLRQTKDSVFVKLKNRGLPLPIKLTALKKKKIVDTKWTPVFKDTITVAFPKKETTHYVADIEEKLPEFSRRNNYYKRTGLLSKKLQLRLFQDIENPEFTQIYTVPVYDFNVYDGLILGSRFLNKPLTPRLFNVDVTPSIGLRSQELQGSLRLGYSHEIKKYGWSFLNFGISASTSSFAEGLTFRRYTPGISLSYRPYDLRKNLSQSISTRLVSIQRERDESIVLETPNYNVFNLRYRYFFDNLTRRLSVNTDFQAARNFSRVSATFNYRKLFRNNRQVNFRAFAGTFLFNDTAQDGDFFSFALDRPSDYLFDFGYFARDDDSGLASQQFITAEGNFKSIFQDRFANQWISTVSLETTIWNWIFVYSNFGLLKSNGRDIRERYDSGIRLNLVQDYFELYFPIQSSLGFEPGFSDYAQRIRFKASFSINTIVKLFTREWY